MDNDMRKTNAASGTTGNPKQSSSHNQGMSNDLDGEPATLGAFRRLQDREKFKKAWVKSARNPK